MFNAVERLPVVIEMIVADTEQRQAALDRLLPMQRATSAHCSRPWRRCR
jgi:pyruvate, orthophosphate dikinase